MNHTPAHLTPAQADALLVRLRRVEKLLEGAKDRNEAYRLLDVEVELRHLWYASQALGEKPPVEPPLDAAEFEDVLDQLLAAVGRTVVLHRQYKGKAMPADVYDTFATERDDVIPALRNRLLSEFSEAELPNMHHVLSCREHARESLSALCTMHGHQQSQGVKDAVTTSQVAALILQRRHLLLESAAVHRLTRRAS